MMPLSTLLTAPLWSEGERELICLHRQDETRDGDTITATTFVFQTHPQPSRFHYRPGQFLLLSVTLDGERLHRAYSLSSSPTRPNTLAITVKRVAGGRVSNHVLDTLQPGMTLRALAPSGQFHLPDTLPRNLLLLSGGSGITPMLSISRALLDLHADCQIHFVHSARHAADLIARQQLVHWAQRHPNFHLTLLLEQTSSDLACIEGRLSAEHLATLTAPLSDYAIFLCGPGGYMSAVKTLLADTAYQNIALYQEDFSPSTAPGSAPHAGTSPQGTTADVGLSAPGFSLSVPAFGHQSHIGADETLLAALEREGLPIIGACRAGVCGSCKCKLEQGEVESGPQLALSAEQIAEGYVLACASTPRSDLQVTLG
jgi:NADH oxidoreductase Hcr